MLKDTLIYFRDTVTHFGPIPVLLSYTMDGSASVMDTIRYVFGGSSQRCWTVEDTYRTNGNVISDTALIFGSDTIAKGDTTNIQWTRNVERQRFSIALTLPLYASAIEVKFDTNLVNHSVKKDTIRSSGRVDEYYDPRTGDTLRLQ